MSIRVIVAAAALSLGLASAASAQTKPTPEQRPPTCPCPAPGARAGGMPMHGMGMCGQMGQMADVRVESTRDGATVHFDAKDPSQVEAVRGMAQRMSNCMAAQAPADQDK